MTYYIKVSISIMLFILTLKSIKAQDIITINSSTNLVSINNVIQLNKKSIQEEKEVAQLFITKYSNYTLIPKNKKDDKFPIFSAALSLSEDSMLVFDCVTYLYNPTESKDITDVINFKIFFYFKTSKMKYDISNFSHQYWGFNKHPFNGGKFENEEPDEKGGFGKKKWLKIKLETLDKAKLIAKAIEEYFTNEHAKQTDF